MRADPRAVAPAAGYGGAGAIPFVVWTLYVFIVSLPFDSPERRTPVELTTILGAVFLLATLTRPSLCYRRPPAAFWLFAIYMCVLVVSFVVNGAEYPEDTLKTFLTRSLLVLIFLPAYNLMRDPRVARHCLIIFGVACALLAVLTLTSIVGMSDVAKARVTAFGQNPNRSALFMGSGILALVAASLGGVRPPFRPRLLALGLAAVAAAAQLGTGSRGSLLALVAGLWALTLGGRGFKLRFRNALLSLVGLTAVAWAALQSPVMARRLEHAQQGDFAGREEIFPLAWGMVQERPLFGWGPAGNSYELAMRISDGVHVTRDTHNLVLEVLTTVGIVGTLPFFAALALCVLGAWRARHGPMGIGPFALCAAILVANMSGNYIGLKLTWFVLALAMASGRLFAPSPEPVPAPPPLRRRWSLPATG